MPERIHFPNLPAPADRVADLARASGLHELLVAVLYQRGLTTDQALQEFLAPDLSTGHDPHALADMDRAVDRLHRALADRESIRIYGDYDVDGVTATALLVRALRRRGGRVDARIPDRHKEGYGLSCEAVEAAARDGIQVLVTVDCGTSAVQEAQLATRLGLDLIITDHHTPPANLPPALAVLNPRRSDCRYPFKDLAGVGVAYKLVCALDPLPVDDPCHRSLLDLVALGTTADVAPLHGENRIFVKYGLVQLAQTCWPGLRALLDHTELVDDEISAGQLVFNVAPRINAAGRMAHAEAALNLLLTDDPFVGADIARELEEHNRQRREADEEALRHALVMLETQGGVGDRSALVLCADRWHPGVIGIVASRLAERFQLPTILVAFQGEFGRGSGRSVDGFNLFDAISACSGFLDEFGGHRHAAGLSLTRNNAKPFTDAFENEVRNRMKGRVIVPSVEVDVEVLPAQLDQRLLRDLKRLEPFGARNRRPQFLLRGANVSGAVRKVGSDGAHLRFAIESGGRAPIDVIGFGFGARRQELGGAPVDLVFVFEENVFRGNRRPQIRLKALFT